VLYVREGTAWAAEAKAGGRTTGGGGSAGAATSIIAGGLASCGNVACALAVDDVVVSGVQALSSEDLADLFAARSVGSGGKNKAGALLEGARFVAVLVNALKSGCCGLDGLSRRM
jgi:hypothetical protein